MSLRKHFADITQDSVLSKMQLLRFSETWTDVLLQVEGYIGLSCDKNVDPRAGGVAIYAKNDFGNTVAPFSLPVVNDAIVSLCADVCAVMMCDGTVIATVYIPPATIPRQTSKVP